MTTVSPPNPSDTRSVLADWMEVCALLDSRRMATRASLRALIDILEDEVADAQVYEEGIAPHDRHILEEGREQFVEIAFEELGYREAVLGESYPFELGPRNGSLICRDELGEINEGRLVYVFCLLTTALREKKLKIPGDKGEAARSLADCFQVCACLAAGGYVDGHVASFGFPRATEDAFLPALKAVYRRFGYGQVIEKITPGLPQHLKDGGIDVIAWKDHPDRLPGKFYLIGQCASGSNWQDKSVVPYIEALHGSWFVVKPDTYFAPAMFIPFPIQHELSESPDAAFADIRVTSTLHFQRQFGIVFDRLRIAHYATLAGNYDEPKRREIEGADRMQEVRDWVRNALNPAVALNEQVAA